MSNLMYTSTTSKYKRVREADKSHDPNKDPALIRLSGKGKVANYIAYAATLFEPPKSTESDTPPKKAVDKVTLVATGSAVVAALIVSQVLQRTFKGIHSLTEVSSIDLVQKWDLKDPATDGPGTSTDLKLHLETTKTIAYVRITLGRNKVGDELKELSEKGKLIEHPGKANDTEQLQPDVVLSRGGYQPPLPDSELNLKTIDEILARKKRNSGGGPGKKSKGSGAKGSSDGPENRKSGRKSKGKGKKGKGNNDSNEKHDDDKTSNVGSNRSGSPDKSQPDKEERKEHHKLRGGKDMSGLFPPKGKGRKGKGKGKNGKGKGKGNSTGKGSDFKGGGNSGNC